VGRARRIAVDHQLIGRGAVAAERRFERDRSALADKVPVDNDLVADHTVSHRNQAGVVEGRKAVERRGDRARSAARGGDDRAAGGVGERGRPSERVGSPCGVPGPIVGHRARGGTRYIDDAGDRAVVDDRRRAAARRDGDVGRGAREVLDHAVVGDRDRRAIFRIGKDARGLALDEAGRGHDDRCRRTGLAEIERVDPGAGHSRHRSGRGDRQGAHRGRRLTVGAEFRIDAVHRAGDWTISLDGQAAPVGAVGEEARSVGSGDGARGRDR
jgi:hypothetical protein